MKIGTVNLAITNRCNYRCSHCCFNSGDLYTDELPSEYLNKILRDLRELGAEKIDITGGEPLVRDDIVDIVKICKTEGYKIKLLTNGLLLTEQMIGSLIDVGLDAVGISIDGSTPKIYNHIRNSSDSTFYRVLDNLGEAISSDLYVKVNTVALKSNIDDLPNIVELCSDIGVDEHRVCCFTPKGRGINYDNTINSLEWLEFIKNDFGDEYPNLFVGLYLADENIDGECLLKEEIPIHIMSNGDVYPCSLLALEIAPIGNATKEPVEDIIQRYKQKPLESCYSETLIEGLKCVCPLRKFSVGESYE